MILNSYLSVAKSILPLRKFRIKFLPILREKTFSRDFEFAKDSQIFHELSSPFVKLNQSPFELSRFLLENIYIRLKDVEFLVYGKKGRGYLGLR